MNQHTTSLERDKEVEKSLETRQLILFKVGGQCYALFIEDVSEVLATPLISQLPLAPPYIKGLSNVRGNIYALFDLEIKFHIDYPSIKQQDIKDYPFTLLLNTNFAHVGILLKQVPDTLEVSQDQIDQTPLLLRENQSDKSYIKGIIRHDEKLILLLDGNELSENINTKL